MTDFHRINEPRAQKIAAMLDTIEKSSRSNRVSAEDLATLLAPLAERLAALAGPDQHAGPDAETVMREAMVEPAAPPTPGPDWRHGDVARIVAAIPDNLVTSVAVQIVHRMSEAYETRGAS